MRCPIEAGNSAEMMLALTAGRLTAAEQEQFEAHMAGCSECRRLAEAQRSVSGALDAWAAPSISEDFDARLMARIGSAERRQWWRPQWHIAWQRALPVAAACLLLIGVVLMRSPWPAQAPPAAVQTQQDAQNVDVDQVERALDDLDMLNQLDAQASPPSGS